MITLDEAVKRLEGRKGHFFETYPLKELAIFGSLARGEANEESDIDILVEFSEPVGFEIVDLLLELEALLEHEVDLVSKKGVRPELFQYISKDLVYV